MSSQKLFSLLVVCGLSACSCDGGGVGNTSAGFHTTTSEVDFGRALEGTSITRTIELTATGRADVVVDVSTDAPFSAPSSISVPGGASANLSVTFTAGNGESSGKLVLSARGESFAITLHGVGLHPLDCRPSAPCREAHFALDTESCVETVVDDGARCTPPGLCLENGVCRGGVCVGTPRRCDDGNACTQDACAPDVGCIHIDVSAQCPQPQNPCQVATCNPTSGCGLATRDDDAVCGSVDCTTAHLCRAGRCLALPTPEGFLCAPATPCQGEGHCSGGKCVRPDAGSMSASWSVTLGESPADVLPESGRLFASNGNLFFQTCNLSSLDGGCALLSYTSNGFERFAQPVSEAATLRAVTPSVALIAEGDQLEAFASSGGAPVWSLAMSSLSFAGPSDAGVAMLPRGALAVTSDAGVALAVSWRVPGEPNADGGADTVDGGPDGGPPLQPATGVTYALVDPSDGGVLRAELLASADFGSALGLGSEGAVWLAAPAAAVVYGRAVPDARLDVIPLARAIIPGRTLSVGGGGTLAFVGGEHRIDLDGGTLALLEPRDGGFGEEPLDLEVLSNGGVGFVFFRACRLPFPAPCADAERSTVVRAFSISTGQTIWEAPVLPGLASGSVIEAALPDGPLAGSILTLTQADLPMTGLRADVQLFMNGQRAMLCPLEGSPRVAGALFDQGRLFVLVDRAGKWRLEAYELGLINFAQTGWTRFGASASGGRRER